MAVTSFVFAGINGSVIALDETTGDQVWVTSLKGSEFVNLVLSENKLYATTKGEIEPDTRRGRHLMFFLSSTT